MSMDRQHQLEQELKSAMLEAIEDFFETHINPADESANTGVTDRRLQLATAVLLIEMTRADHETKPEERLAVTKAVEKALGLTADETAEIVRLAEKQVERSVPMYQFARLIDQSFSMPRKKLLIEQMWRVAFSDAQILAHEEYLVRKLSGLLHVPLADFLEAKIEARDDFR